MSTGPESAGHITTVIHHKNIPSGLVLGNAAANPVAVIGRCRELPWADKFLQDWIKCLYWLWNFLSDKNSLFELNEDFQKLTVRQNMGIILPLVDCITCIETGVKLPA